MEEYNLYDLTSCQSDNDGIECKYLCVILWQKKPFKISNIILSYSAQETIEKMHNIDDCTTQPIQVKLRKLGS